MTSKQGAYYQSVEEFFVERRGDPLFLSSSEWLLVRGWREQRIPLRVVLRGIADALDGHAHSWGRKQKVGSLAYCKAEVERARERWQHAIALGREEAADIPGFLRGIAASLRDARLGAHATACAEAIAQEVLRLAESPVPARDLEGLLSDHERTLETALHDDAGAEALAAIEAAVEKDLSPYKDRMPKKVLDQVRAEGITRRLFESHGLPRLSLFLR